MEAAVCVGMEIGNQVGVGVGITMPNSERRLWIAPHLSPELRWNATRSLGVSVGLEVAFPLYRHRFAIAPYGEVFRSNRAAIRGFFGLEWLFATEPGGARH